MNWNAIKTFLLGSGLLAIVGPKLINMATSLAGCTGDDPATPAVEIAKCTGGTLLTIPEPLQAIVGGVVIALALAGTGWLKKGTVMQNLFGQSVPVVPWQDAKPGTVTIDQVLTQGPR